MNINVNCVYVEIKFYWSFCLFLVVHSDDEVTIDPRTGKHSLHVYVLLHTACVHEYMQKYEESMDFIYANLFLCIDIDHVIKAIVKMMSMDKMEKTQSLSKPSLSTATSSSVIREKLHPLGKMAGLHSAARTKLEMILAEILGSANIHEIPAMSEEGVDLMLEFARCLNSSEAPNCSATDKFRSIDGTCNNLEYPSRGAANTAFKRLQPAEYEDGISLPVGYDQQVNGNPFTGPWPSARTVSAAIIRDLPIQSTALTHLVMTWGQFIDHDLDLFAEFETEVCEETCDIEEYNQICYPINVSPRDSVFGRKGPNRGECLPLTRSVGTCESEDFDIARQQINQLTHFVDGSMVYGSTQEVADRLRLFTGGLLKQGGVTGTQKGNLPFKSLTDNELSDSGVPNFDAGDVRVNENVPLTIMHTIWVRQHNYIVTELAKLNPCWDDERLYQEGRKIVGAIIQIVTYKEFLPLIFGEEGFNTFIGSYPGYSPNTDATIPNSFATAAFRFGHTLIRPEFTRLDKDNKPLEIGSLSLRESFFNPLQYFLSGGTDPILRGLIQDRSREVDIFLNMVLTKQLFASTSTGLGQDLASRNIQRGREHGQPSYRTFQEYCFNIYGVPSRFHSLILRLKFRRLYGFTGFRNGIDLFAGGLAEERMSGSNLGPTFACIIGKTFADVRNGDRFYWENPGVFTSSQRDSLSDIRFSKVICDNADDITTIVPKVFQTGQEEQSCDSLPSLDLSHWTDTC